MAGSAAVATRPRSKVRTPPGVSSHPAALVRSASRWRHRSLRWAFSTTSGSHPWRGLAWVVAIERISCLGRDRRGHSLKARRSSTESVSSPTRPATPRPTATAGRAAAGRCRTLYAASRSSMRAPRRGDRSLVAKRLAIPPRCAVDQAVHSSRRGRIEETPHPVNPHLAIGHGRTDQVIWGAESRRRARSPGPARRHTV